MTTAEHDYESVADALAETGAMSRAQAEAYALREVLNVPRQEAATRLDIGVTGLDDRLQRARENVEASLRLAALVEEVGVSADDPPKARLGRAQALIATVREEMED